MRSETFISRWLVKRGESSLKQLHVAAEIEKKFFFLEGADLRGQSV